MKQIQGAPANLTLNGEVRVTAIDNTGNSNTTLVQEAGLIESTAADGEAKKLTNMSQKAESISSTALDLENRIVTIVAQDAKDIVLTAEKGTVSTKADAIETSAATSITNKVGDSTIKMSSSQINVDATKTILMKVKPTRFRLTKPVSALVCTAAR